MSEINRRLLPPGLADVDTNDDRGTGVVYIDGESVDDAVHLLGFELARRFGEPELVGSIFDEALAVYSEIVRPTLSTAGLAHERPMFTNQLRQAVLQMARGHSRPSTES